MSDRFRRLVPPVAAIILIVAFANLGFWQLERAAEKEERTALFADDAPATRLSDLGDPVLYRRVEAYGRYLPETQVLVDNIVRTPRIGYYVITALETAPDAPLLLVNRGWVEKPPRRDELPDIEADGGWRTVRGRVGNLPRVGIRSGDAFAGAEGWPRIGVYPTTAEVAAQFGRDVRPFVLLLDPGESDGFLRQWQPQESGPLMHYGYAFQWFAMCAAVVAVSIWQLRKRWRSR